MKEVIPFTSLSWRTQAIRDVWEPIRKKIYEATNIAEYEMIKEGKRSCDVYSFTPSNFDNQINWVSENKFVPLTILRSKMYEGFGHRHYGTDQLGPDVFVYSVIADTYENAKKFRDASMGIVDHRVIGQLLGYPECCIDFFLPIWLDKHVMDPLFEIALNTEGHVMLDDDTVEVHGNPLLNRFSRYFGLCVAPFFLHSYKCPEAVKFCQGWYDIMHKHYPYESEKLLELLSMPVTWSHHNMITRIEHPLYKGATNGFDWDIKKVVKWFPE